MDPVENIENTLNAENNNGWIYWLKFLLMVSMIPIVIFNALSITTVSGSSMNPTFSNGDIVVVNKLSRYFGMPSIGDVVIIIDPKNGYRIIKRVMGLPGNVIEIKDGILYIDGNAIPEILIEGKSADMKPIKVPSNQMFILGDNRNPGESMDSRDPDIGTIPLANLVGDVTYSLKPFQPISKSIPFK